MLNLSPPVLLTLQDGKLLSATVVTAYLVFIGVFSSPLTGYKLFNLKRNQPDGSKHSSVNPPASYLRYCCVQSYFVTMVIFCSLVTPNVLQTWYMMMMVTMAMEPSHIHIQ